MRAVFFEVCQRLMVVSYCMPGSPHCQVASEIFFSRSLAGYVSILAIDDGAGGEVGVAHHGDHEVVGDADAVVGVLEEDGAVGVGVGMRSVVALGYEGVGLGFFFLLHSMKSTMSGWSMFRMTILAARRVLPPDLMTPAKASKPFMKLSGPWLCLRR